MNCEKELREAVHRTLLEELDIQTARMSSSLYGIPPISSFDTAQRKAREVLDRITRYSYVYIPYVPEVIRTKSSEVVSRLCDDQEGVEIASEEVERMLVGNSEIMKHL